MAFLGFFLIYFTKKILDLTTKNGISHKYIGKCHCKFQALGEFILLKLFSLGSLLSHYAFFSSTTSFLISLVRISLLISSMN